MKAPTPNSWEGQWSSQYDAANPNEYGLIPILIGLAIIGGGGGYMAYESAQTALEHTQTSDMWAALRVEYDKRNSPLTSWRDERVQTMWLNAPANDVEADIMAAFWMYRAARQAKEQVGFTAYHETLIAQGDMYWRAGEQRQAVAGWQDHTGQIMNILKGAAAKVGDIDIGMRVAVQDLANPRAIEQRRHLTATLGNPDWMRWQWAKETGSDIAQLATDPMAATGIDDLVNAPKNLWDEYKWWIIGIGGGYLLLNILLAARGGKKSRAPARARARPPARSRPSGRSLSEIRGGS